MTIKKRQRKPDWNSIKKYVVARMREQRAWLENKLKAERTHCDKQRAIRDEAMENIARGLQETIAKLERDS